MSGIRHVVMFKAHRREDVESIVALLESLAELPSVRHLDVERDLGLHPPAFHLVFITDHAGDAELAEFRADPRHLEVVAQLKALVAERATVDYRLADRGTP